MTVPSAAVMVSSGPTGAAPWDTHGRISTPSKRTPTAPSVRTSSPRKSGVSSSGDRPEASPPSSGTIGEAAESRRRTASAGKVKGSASMHRARRAVQLGQAGEHALAAADRLHDRVEGRRLAVRRAPPPTRTPRCRPRPRATPRSRRPRRSRRATSGSSVSCSALQRRLRRREVRAGREHDREVAGAAAEARLRGRGRLHRAHARVGRGREPGADADPHALLTLPALARCHPARRARGPIVALFGPTGVGKTAVAVALAERLRGRRGGPGRRLRRRAADLPRPRDAHRRADGRRARRARAPARGRPARHRERFGGRLRAPRPRGDRRAAGRRAAADRGGRHRPLPARGARRPRPAPARRPPARASAGPRGWRPRAPRRCTRGSPSATRPPPPRRRRPTGGASSRALELLDAGARAAAARRRRSCGPRTPATRRCSSRLTMERAALYARIDARVDAMVAAGAAGRSRARGGGRRVAGRPPGAGLRGAAARRRGRPCRRAPAATPSASSPGCASCPARSRSTSPAASPPARRRRHPRRARGAGMMRGPMRFEKWQALGNDYLILEAARAHLPAHPRAVRRLCARHFGPGADGVLLLAPPDEPGFVARLRIYNPDGSEAELSGNGAREAILYLRRAGWTDQDTFSIQTAAGRDPSHDHRPDHLPRRHGPGAAALEGLSRRAGRTAPARSPATASSTSRSATRSARSASPDVADARAPRPAAVGPAIERDPRFPNRTNVSFYARARPGRDPRAHLRARGGGDAVLRHRRERRGGRPRAARRRLARSPSASTAASWWSRSTPTCTSTSPAGPCRSIGAS